MLLALLFLAGAEASAQPVDRQVPQTREQVRLSFAPVVKEVAPAVVSITSRKRRPAREPLFDDPFFQFFFRDFGGAPRARREVETSLGSGVIVRPDGVVVTNHHVVDDADQIEVVLPDRRSFAARPLASDPQTDLAFLKLEIKGERLPTLTLGDSDAIEVGDLVLAIGNPFGIGQTVTSGIVSAKSRTAPQLERDVSFIQTDAAINPGNSGGALVTLDGRLIGVNTAIFTRSGGSIGIGFAIPSNLVKARLAALGSGGGEIRRPWLGAVTEAVDGAVAAGLGLERPAGVVVTRVYPGSPAERAGLQPGDVILAVDGVAVDDPSSLNYRLSLKPLGERARLELVRRGRTQTANLTVESARQEPAPAVTRLTGRHPLAGLTVANMSPGFNEQHGLDMFERGVVVLEVARGSFADRLPIRPGDVIHSVNGRDVASVEELERALSRSTPRWQIGVRRGGQVTLLQVQ